MALFFFEIFNRVAKNFRIRIRHKMRCAIIVIHVFFVNEKQVKQAFRTSSGVLGFLCFFFKCEQRKDRHLSDRSIVTKGSFRRIAQVEDSDREIEGHFKMCHLWCGYSLVPCELSRVAKNFHSTIRHKMRCAIIAIHVFSFMKIE